MIEIPNKQLFRPDEVAELLGVHVATIYRRIEDGTLMAIKVGSLYRVTRGSLAALVNPADT